ncbi:MAG: DUF58 domain-containing protein [Clostridia bacterium]|nr:DUF58 domain-containing protein [Clostridia bacterium]
MKRTQLKPMYGVLLLMLLMIFLVAFTGSYFFYFMLLTIFMAAVFMFILVQSNRRKIFQFLNFSTHEMVAGEELTLDITSSNNSIFPVSHAKISCKIYNDNQKMTLPTENIFFNPFQIINIQESFVINTRGIFSGAVLMTEVQDPLKLFKRTITMKRPLELIVYPKIHELSYFYMPITGYLGTHKIVKSGQEDYSSLKKVRPYIHGDSMKRIHWKLSSKRNEFFVKEYDATSSIKMNMFVNAFVEDYSKDKERLKEDAAIEVTASIAKYALNHNIETSLQYQSSQYVNIESRDMSSFPVLLKDLVTFNPQGDSAFSEVISQASKRFDYGSFIIAVTPQIDQGLVNVLMGLTRRAFKISLVLIHGDQESENHLNLLTAHGVKVYSIMPEDSIKAKLEVF